MVCRLKESRSSGLEFPEYFGANSINRMIHISHSAKKSTCNTLLDVPAVHTAAEYMSCRARNLPPKTCFLRRSMPTITLRSSNLQTIHNCTIFFAIIMGTFRNCLTKFPLRCCTHGNKRKKSRCKSSIMIMGKTW